MNSFPCCSKCPKSQIQWELAMIYLFPDMVHGRVNSINVSCCMGSLHLPPFIDQQWTTKLAVQRKLRVICFLIKNHSINLLLGSWDIKLSSKKWMSHFLLSSYFSQSSKCTWDCHITGTAKATKTCVYFNTNWPHPPQPKHINTIAVWR